VGDITVAVVYPDLLGTYGDGGNAVILAKRLQWRGLDAEVVTVPLGTPLPRTCDIYVLGGGEDAPQALAAATLRDEGALTAAVDDGAAVLAVCAGFQVIGTRFRTSDGIHDGVGLVDCETTDALATRAVGELVVDPDPALGLPRLSGYENHASATTLGPGVRALGQVAHGIGNGNAADGCVVGKVFGTYLHGPVLARNPELADLVLRAVVSDLSDLPPSAADDEAQQLRQERLAAATGRRRRFHHFGT
jgi:CobQ-like glutamine amidotransferase family enzyme